MKSCSRNRSRNTGLSVIEVMGALTVFGIVAAGLAANTVGSIRANRISRDISAAAALAHDKMEELRTLDPALNPADLTAGTKYDPNNPVTAAGIAGGPFTRKWTVTRNTPVNGLSRVVIEVSWTDGTERTMRVVAYVCQSRVCT
jgi:type II secretory pathway pseudopilin PulG